MTCKIDVVLISCGKMRLKDFKIEINSHSIFLFLFITIFLGMNLSPVSAATIDIASGLQNSDIQTLIDGSQQGDTINFIGILII